MDKVKKEFETIIEERLTVGESYQFNNFVKEYPKVYNFIIYGIRELLNRNIKNENVFLLKNIQNIDKLRLTVGKRKLLVFCGVFEHKGENVIIVNNALGVGTYFLDDSKIVKQLIRYPIGLKISLEKNNLGGIDMVLPYDDVRIGLFED